MRARGVRSCVSLVTFAAVTTLVVACTREPVPASTLADWYAPPPPVRTFPIRAESIHSWIRGGDTATIRQHAWDLWESITSPSPQDSAVPVWETWYAGHEIFEMDPSATDLVRHPVRYRFEFPRQARHAVPEGVRIPHDPAERWLSFNRYTRPTAQQIFKRQLWSWTRLKAINDSFNTNNTPVAEREVLVSAGKVDPQSIVLKPVFQFIDGTSNSCIPYWNGNTPATSSNNNNPVPITWKQFVVVDVTNQYGDLRETSDSVPGCPQGTWQIVKPSQFYAITITQEMADSASAFMEGSGDDIGSGDSTTQAALQEMIKAGNLALLVAMHVTGKEIVEWTWQTFWWSPAPNDSMGYDRPTTIGAPWNNYQMNTAYQMVTPARSEAKGTPRIAFNPYLETSLCSDQQNGCVNATWYGPTTNCMSCHRMAAWKDTVVTDTANKPQYSVTAPPYVPAMFVNKASADTFGTFTKTDFLWSVVIRTRAIPPYPPGVATK